MSACTEMDCVKPSIARGLCGAHYQRATAHGELHQHPLAAPRPLIDRTVGKTCPPDHKHGATDTCYNGHGCRCARCRRAKAASRHGYEWETRRRRGQDVRVPSTGTVRRLRALAVMGWAISSIAAESGLFPRSLMKVREGSRERVHLSTYRAVVAVYEQKSMIRNLTREGRITATNAAARGWLPPLVWDDPDRDMRPKGAAA